MLKNDVLCERGLRDSLARWLRHDPDIIGRAGYRTATRCGVSRADADDAIADVIETTCGFFRPRKCPARNADECVMWLCERARRVLLRTRRTPDVGFADAPAGWTAGAMEAIPDARAACKQAIARALEGASDADETTTAVLRTLALLATTAACTLEEAGDELDVSKEYVRQLRSALLAHLRRWAAGHVVFLTRPPLVLPKRRR